jgi:hypothetical protein
MSSLPLWMGVIFCQSFFFSKYFKFFSLLIYSYVHTLCHFSPLPRIPLTSRQNLFCPFLQFCWKVDISNNKKDIAFLLVEIRIAIQRAFFFCIYWCILINYINWFLYVNLTLHTWDKSHLVIVLDSSFQSLWQNTWDKRRKDFFGSHFQRFQCIVRWLWQGRTSQWGTYGRAKLFTSSGPGGMEKKEGAAVQISPSKAYPQWPSFLPLGPALEGFTVPSNATGW